MKNLFLLLSLVGLFAFTSCSDECTQNAYCELVSSQDYGKVSDIKTDDKVKVCHEGITLEILKSSLQDHLNHGDTEGECQTLSSSDLEFRDGEVVQIPCNYELPFVHTTENGTQWYYSKPGSWF